MIRTRATSYFTGFAASAKKPPLPAFLNLVTVYSKQGTDGLIGTANVLKTEIKKKKKKVYVLGV